MGISGNYVAIGGVRRLAAAALAIAAVAAAEFVAAPQAHAMTNSSLSCAAQSKGDSRYNCTISGVTDQGTVTLPLAASNGVWLEMPATVPMKSGAGTMTVTEHSIIFKFLPSYMATHSAPFKFSGGLSFWVDGSNSKGPFTVTVNGRTYVTQGTPGSCGPNCTTEPLQKGTRKEAWDGANGRAEWTLIRGGDVVVVGQRIDFVDHAGAGQSDCVGEIEQQHADGSWSRVAGARTDAAGTTVTGSYTPLTGGAVQMIGSCRADGTQSVYTDNGTIAGVAVNARTTVTNIWADGRGTNKPVPTVTETYQVDVARLRSNAVVNKYAAADNDGVLAYRELAPLWQKAAYAKYFSEKHEFVTITVPTNAGAAQRIAAINAKTRLGDVTTTARMGTSKAKRLTVVMAWKLDTAHGAKPVDGGLAWGPKHNLMETYFARS